jgi:hypothetical protein
MHSPRTEQAATAARSQNNEQMKQQGTHSKVNHLTALAPREMEQTQCANISG